jgi:hypothetical protein
MRAGPGAKDYVAVFIQETKADKVREALHGTGKIVFYALYIHLLEAVILDRHVEKGLTVSDHFPDCLGYSLVNGSHRLTLIIIKGLRLEVNE